MTRIRVGTRGSQLALWQAREVSRLLRHSGYVPEIITVKTTGDTRQDVPLASVGGKGLFIKELEEALDRREIDIAVHSLKDVPSIIPERFTLAGFLERADPRDAWLHREHTLITDLSIDAVIGTSAPRRQAQLAQKFPYMKIVPIRGNVETRIRKMQSENVEGVVLAAAGLKRLNLASHITMYFPVDDIVPAAGQGIVAIETRSDDLAAYNAARAINHAETELMAVCERGVLQRFDTRLDCYSAVAVHATIDEGQITIRSYFQSVRTTHTGRDHRRLISAVYDELVSKGVQVS